MEFFNYKIILLSLFLIVQLRGTIQTVVSKDKNYLWPRILDGNEDDFRNENRNIASRENYDMILPKEKERFVFRLGENYRQMLQTTESPDIFYPNVAPYRNGLTPDCRLINNLFNNTKKIPFEKFDFLHQTMAVKMSDTLFHRYLLHLIPVCAASQSNQNSFSSGDFKRFITSKYPNYWPSEKYYYRGTSRNLYQNFRYRLYSTPYYHKPSRSPYFTDSYQKPYTSTYRYWPYANSYYYRTSRSPYFIDNYQKSYTSNYGYWPYATSNYERTSRRLYFRNIYQKSYTSNFKYLPYSRNDFQEYEMFEYYGDATPTYYPELSPTASTYHNKDRTYWYTKIINGRVYLFTNTYYWHTTKRPTFPSANKETAKNSTASYFEDNNTSDSPESNTHPPLKVFVVFDYTLFELIEMLSLIQKICLAIIIGLIFVMIISCLKRQVKDINIFTVKKDDYIYDDKEKLLIV